MPKTTLLLSFFLAFAAGATPVQSESVVFGGGHYRVAEIDPNEADIKLYWKKADGQAFQTLASLREVLGRDFLLATNAGMYATDSTPLGLHIEDGKTLRKINRSRASTGNFFMVPNGVFAMTNAGAKIVETEEFAKGKTAALAATQSGPLLVRSGRLHPRFQPNSKNLKLRSGIGVRPDGHVVIAISHGPVSFHDFAAFFKERLRCPDALYLDGTISTLLIGETEASQQLAPYVGMIGVTRKKGKIDALKK